MWKSAHTRAILYADMCANRLQGSISNSYNWVFVFLSASKLPFKSLLYMCGVELNKHTHTFHIRKTDSQLQQQPFCSYCFFFQPFPLLLHIIRKYNYDRMWPINFTLYTCARNSVSGCAIGACNMRNKHMCVFWISRCVCLDVVAVFPFRWWFLWQVIRRWAKLFISNDLCVFDWRMQGKLCV